MISLAVVQALLSADAPHRQAAEAHLQSLPVTTRVGAWSSVWHEATSAHQDAADVTPVLHLIAVLWRRDILQCGDAPQTTAALLAPLRHIFCGPAGLTPQIRSAIGYCLAEVVALADTSLALEQTLQATEALLATQTGPVLDLYQALGQAVPAPLWSPAATAWLVERLGCLTPPAAAATGFATAATLAATHGRTRQVMDTVAALARRLPAAPWQALATPWLHATTDADTLAHILEAGFDSFTPAFWVEAWRQIQPHVSSAPRLVCHVLERLGGLAETPLTAAQAWEAVQGLVPILARAVDDDMDEWEAVEWLGGEEGSYETDHDEEGLASYAMDVLQLWLVAEPSLLEPLWQLVQSTLGETADWRSVWTVLTVWQVALSALPVALTPHATVLYQSLCHVVASHPHDRVRHQAWQTLAGVVQTYPHVVTDADALANALGQEGLVDGQPRVVAAACQVLTSVAAACTDDNHVWQEGQLQILLQGLTHAEKGALSPQASSRLVVVRALRAVAALARSAPLAHFYAPTMTLLLEWSNREASVTGDALEAASVVALSLVDSEDEALVTQIRSDAQSLLQRLLYVLPGAANREPLLSACARLAPVLGDDFAPYLPALLPLLLEKVTAQDEIELADGDAAGLDQTRRQEWQDDSLTVALPGRGLTKVTVHTTQIEEKAQAIRALYELATALPSAWAPHLESTWQAIEPLLGYRYHADIRTTAAQSMSALVEAGFESRYDPVWTGFPRVAVAVARQLINEANTEPEDWYALADSLSEVMYSAFARKGDFQAILLQSYTGAVAEEVVQCCAQALQQCLQRRTAITTRMSSSSNPDELECCQQELKDEEKLLTPLVDSIGYSLKILGPSFVSIFEQKVAPLLGPYLRPNADARARLSAVCLFDDCVEHCGAQAAARFGPQLLPGVLTGMSAEDDDLKQASIYGIAQIARYSPHDVLAQDAASVIQALASTASKPQEAAESEAIFENSVSALASLSIFMHAPFQGKYLKHEMGVQILLENLPLTTDFDEAKVCSTGLCDMVEAGAIPVATYTKPLVRVIGETLALVADDEEVATAAACTRMAGILVRLQQEASSADLQDAFSTLTPESQTAIHTAVEQYSYLHNNVVTP